MKNLKLIITLSVSIAFFSSCTQNELESQNQENQKVFVEKGVSLVSGKLISKKLLTASEVREEQKASTADGWYEAPYAQSIPIYRYLYYGSYENIDHY